MSLPTTSQDISDLPAAALATRVPGQPLSASTTTLVSDLGNQPWQDIYQLGKGVNAVTGILCGHALEPSTVTPAQHKDAHTSFTSVTSTSDVDSLITASASATYNIGGLSMNASSEYLSQVKQSKMDMTILATYEVFYNDYDVLAPAGLQFTGDAKQLLDAGRFEDFRKLYGDYYIGGYKRMATFRAIYTISTTSEETLDQVKAAIGAEVPDMFTAEGETAFKKAIANKDVAMSFDLDMHGISPTAAEQPSVPAGIDTMQQYLKWFQDNNSPVPDRAELIHYSQLDNRIPTTLPISPDVFTAIGLLYFNTYRVQIMHHSLPPTWQDTYTTQVHTLAATVNANAQNLAGDAPTLAALSTQATTLLTNINNLTQRYIFLHAIRAMQVVEPGIGDDYGQDSSRTFGSIVYPNAANDPAFVIQSSSVNSWQDWESGHVDHDFSLPVSGPIIQWQLQRNKDDDGMWWKNSQLNNTSFILLNNNANIHCHSDFDRGINNTLTVWFVDKSLVPNYTPGVVAAAAPAAE
ncbi:hypothetical protein LGH70_10330 [Hymenobacter sp. BT635]|uniref:MACPF domain-containing protein n=1 Tax=Hymenobacter nitidus TaxID=2880929 RepID=A0ABS8AG57_9BACT|nr:hypothetical protein [Hymenobacter nitidus]MCB2377979.1 hypothetical protein [Hymenobacter nitidus]